MSVDITAHRAPLATLSPQLRGEGLGFTAHVDSVAMAYDAPQMSPLALSVRVERWPIAGAFTISRGAKTEAVVVLAELSDGAHRGRGECVPYARYGETVEGVAAAIAAMAAAIAQGLDREGLQSAMPPGAARNAIDCAFWDLAAKRAGRPAHELLGLDPPKPITTAYTISLATPHAMAQAAAKAADRALLKV